MAQIGTFASLLILGFANSLLLIFASRILDGITGANLATVQSAVSDSTPPEARAAGLGLVGAASGLGSIAGPLLSGLALSLTDSDFSAPAFLAAGFSLASVILTAVVFRETLPKHERHKPAVARRARAAASFIDRARSPELGPFYLFAMGAQLVFTMFTATFTLYTLNRLGFDSPSNAIFLGLFGLMLVAMQGVFVGRLVNRFGEYRVLAAAFVMTAIGFGLAALAPQQAVPWYDQDELADELSQAGEVSTQLALLPPEAGAGLGAFIFILFGLLPGPLGYTLQMPTINALLTKKTHGSEIGETLGISAAFTGAGTVIGPILGGYLFAELSPGAPHALSAVLSVVMLVILLAVVRDPARPTGRPMSTARTSSAARANDDGCAEGLTVEPQTDQPRHADHQPGRRLGCGGRQQGGPASVIYATPIQELRWRGLRVVLAPPTRTDVRLLAWGRPVAMLRV